MNPKFALEFILHARNANVKVIKSALLEFGSELDISPACDCAQTGNYNIVLNTEDPTLVFDLCSQFGRIRSIKVSEQNSK